MRPEACSVAEEALNRIGTHEAVCAIQSQHVTETMDRIESGMNAAHTALYGAIKAVDDRVGGINKTILMVLVWLTVLFGGTAISLIIYIFLNQPKGFVQ